jgi:acyl transferase domain-containing protein/NAD(P)-dependent dehydrogenase (short-subunit alcohol dehydrogenase family)
MKNNDPLPTPVAIIGISCIFADSPDLKSYYGLLTRGISGISDPPSSHSYLGDYLDPDPKKKDHIYCNRGGYLPPVNFDPTEFGIPPNSLEATDTSQLLGLLTAKRAIDDAGYGDNGKPFDRSKASVILGVTGTQELVIPLGARLGHPLWRRALEQAGVPQEQADDVIDRIGAGYVDWQENSFPGLLGNVVAGRIANRLDFGGTNCVVDAACASSMGAIHMALLELYTNRSDMVITGGVDTINDAFMHMCFAKTQLLSPSGDIRPFSKDADGTVLGEGVGLIVVKRLDDAERDGDRIYAVIRGIGSASDGKAQSIYSPRQAGQRTALRRAYECTGVDPSTVAMVEAHGTGTSVGDQVEFKALCDVFGATSPNGNGCALGSVKSNIGHTKAAAGIAGLIKSALSIYHKVLPPTLKAKQANPILGLDHSPFYLNNCLRPWMQSQGQSRKAGVSSFGFGGSNFHTILEEYSANKQEISWDGTIEIAAFSGKSKEDLSRQFKQWLRQVEENPTRFTIGKQAKQSRLNFKTSDPHRIAMVLDLSQGDQQALASLRDAMGQPIETGTALQQGIYSSSGSGSKPGRLAFLFPGQGSQYIGMGRDLICCFPQSLASFQDAAGQLDLEKSLDDYIFPRTESTGASHEAQLRDTRIAQPAIGAASVAMLDALAYFGVTPDATCGHSYGELVALYAAGWIDQPTLWHLSAMRGRLMAEAGKAQSEPGTMLAVKAPLEEIENLVQSINEPLLLANRNTPDQGVLSGTAAAVKSAENVCRSKGWVTIPLPVAAAFHSGMVSTAQEPFTREIEKIKITPTSIDVMSNTIGNAYSRSLEKIRSTLGSQLARPVSFVDNIESLYREGIRTFIEIGPKKTLTNMVDATLTGRNFTALAVDRSCGQNPGLHDLACTLAQMAAMGYDVALSRWEKSTPAARQVRMTVPLSGANYRNPKTATSKPKRRVSGLPDKSIDHEKDIVSPVGTETVAAIQQSIDAKPLTQTQSKPTRDIMDQTTKTSMQNALMAAKQAMVSLQALQSQTAQAHQKFLETQAEAGKTLKQMFQSTQQLAVTALQGPVEPNSAGLAPSQPTGHIGTPPFESVMESKGPNAITEPGSSIGLAAEHVTVSPAPAAQTSSQLEKTLVEIVSELTGYPEQMLGMQMDIEADLGIDSIKRVEILSALEEKMPHLPQVTPDMMGTLKTLEQICDYLAGDQNPKIPMFGETDSTPPVDETQLDISSQPLSRKLVRIVDSPITRRAKWIVPENRYLGIVGTNEALKEALIDKLSKNNITAKSLDDPNDFSKDPLPIGLLMVAPISAERCFEWAKRASVLEQTATLDGACFCAVTFLDGAFGFYNKSIEKPTQAAMAGLIKTADIEWPSVRCLALDIDPNWKQVSEIAAAIANELVYPQQIDSGVEIGLSAARRVQLQLMTSPLAQLDPINLSADDVVVVTGGARGVTAVAAQALVNKTGCKLALLGRTDADQSEPPWLVPLTDPGKMKHAILTHHFTGQIPTPMQVESAYQNFLSIRQINATLKQLSRKSSAVRYYSVDVRDTQKINKTLELIRKEQGAIKAIIHGAGVLADRLIAEKQLEQFLKVYDTKVKGLNGLLDATCNDKLRYLILFSSVSARMGNAGQSDYAMANEVLNKIARQQALNKPYCKVVSINWGPWNGGMVTQGLKTAFTAKGIGLIDPALGAEAMISEMENPQNEDIEVVIGSAFAQKASASITAEPIETVTPDMSTTAKRAIDIDRHPVLRSHQLDGRPVVPLAIMAEWLAHSALHANPGLALHGLDQLRLLNGIVLDGQSRRVRIMAGKAKRKGELYEVDVEIRDDSQHDGEVIHSSAKAILVENRPSAPAFDQEEYLECTSAVRSLEDVYNQILFHGSKLRGLQKICRLSDQGMTARIASAPPPAEWMEKPLRSRWITDPLVIDSAFQMAIVWCYDQLGAVSLPSYAETYRQYRERFPQSGVSAIMIVHKRTKYKIICDFSFVDEDRQVIAALKGYQAVMTPSLMRAFKAA